jgi:hypothetical protein
LVIVNVIVVECVRLPLTPVTVTTKVPVCVCPPLPVNVRVDVPVPPDATVTEDGLKLALTPVGSGPVESVIVPLNPLKDVIVIVVDVELVLAMFRLEGDALMLKSPVVGAFTAME